MGALPNVLQLPFTGGVNQRIADEYVDPTTHLLDAQNVVWTKEGGAQKRPGMLGLGLAQLAGDPAMQPIQRLMTRQGELLAADGDNLFTWSPTLGQWVRRGPLSTCVGSRQHLWTALGSDPKYVAYGFAIAEGAGYRAFAWQNSAGVGSAGDIFVSLQDIATGAFVLSNVKMTVATIYFAPQVHIVTVTQAGVTTPYLLLFYQDGAGPPNNIYGNVLNLSTMTWAGQGTIVSDSGGPFDSVLETNGSSPAVAGVALIYAQFTGGGSPTSSPRVLRLEALPALTISASFLPATYAGGTLTTLVAARVDKTLGIAAFAWEKEVVAGPTYTLNAAVYSAATWAVVTPAFATPDPPNTTSGASNVVLWCETLSAAKVLVGHGLGCAAYTTAPLNTMSCDFQGAVARAGGVVASKPFVFANGTASRCYALIELKQELNNVQATQQQTYELCDLRAYETGSGLFPRPVATIAPRQAYTNWTGLSYLVLRRPMQIVGSGNSVGPQYRCLVACNAVEERLQAGDYNVDLATFDFSGALACAYDEGDELSYIACGVPSFYDGVSVSELGFLQWPSGITSVNAGAGNLTPSATYGYAFCYAQPDSSGLIHRSPFNTLIVTTGPADHEVTFTIPNLVYTNRYANGRVPVVEVWRTQANGTTYTYEGSVSCVPGSSAALSYLSSAADTNIASNPFLPTTGGVLDSVCPPSSSVLIRWNSRIWLVDETGYVLWYTTELSNPEANDAPAFNEGLTIPVPDGPIASIGVADAYLGIFTSGQIHTLTGEGPPPTGQGSDFVNPVPVMTDVGAGDWRGTVEVPQGLVFQAPSGGVYLLGRDLSVQFIGKAVQDWVGSTRVVSALLVPGTQQVRFVLATGAVICWDYVLDRWSRNAYLDGTQPLTPTCAAMLGTTWCTVTAAPAAGVWREKGASDAKPYYDTDAAAANTWITLSLTTGHVKPGGLQGWAQFGAVQAFARWLDPCDTTMLIAYDYGRGVQGAVSFAHAALFAANGQAAQYQLGTQAANAMAQAVQVTLTDAPPSDATAVSGQGVRWLGLALEVIAIGNKDLNLSAAVKK